MIPEIGLLNLCVVFIIACLLCMTPIFMHHYGLKTVAHVSNRLLHIQYICCLVAFFALIFSFAMDDFTVSYVAMHSSRTLPIFYKLCATWGGHEGSVLLWLVILITWTMLVARCLQHTDMVKERILFISIQSLLATGFAGFILLTSNPFDRALDGIIPDGISLNPLLQDIGFLFHPPMLYLGYVGFSVLFSFAMVTLLTNQYQEKWLSILKPFLYLSWSCLTLGITLGSWWAYRELGWGGFWFWDPVENASLMPWLIGTALIHAFHLGASSKRFIPWILFLSIIAFSLSLIGTFLIRSGILTSVHAFATSPTRGLFILIFLSAVIGGGLTLFSVKASQFKAHSTFPFFSHLNFHFLNSLLFFIMMSAILIGTLYPLIIDVFGLGKLSVGAPYFNTITQPLMMPFLIIFGMSMSLFLKPLGLYFYSKIGLLHIFCAVVVTAIIHQYASIPDLITNILCCLVIWNAILLVHLSVLFFNGNKQFFWHKIPMLLSHIGFVIMILGVIGVSAFGIENDILMKPKDSYQFNQNTLVFLGIHSIHKENYLSTYGDFLLYHKDKLVGDLKPEKRLYDVGKVPMTDAGISASFFQDIYVALGESVGDSTWSVRIYAKPLVRWIWLGGVLIFLGGFFACFQSTILFFRKYTKC